MFWPRSAIGWGSFQTSPQAAARASNRGDQGSRKNGGGARKATGGMAAKLPQIAARRAFRGNDKRAPTAGALAFPL